MKTDQRWCGLVTLVEPMREEPRHTAAMVSEARAGERLEVLGRDGNWLRIRSEDGYCGWIHDWNCVPWPSHPGRVIGRYSRPLGTLWFSDHRSAGPLILGLPLLEPEEEGPLRPGRCLVRTTWGTEGWIEDFERMDFGTETSPSELRRYGQMLVGTPYRWGGRSPLGFDCSGFVQYLYALLGRALPRDSRDQLEVGPSIETRADQWKVGDLLFFSDPVDHVALWVGGGRILHCSGQVKEEELGKNTLLSGRLCAVRRPWEGSPALGPSLWAGIVAPTEV